MVEDTPGRPDPRPVRGAGLAGASARAAHPRAAGTWCKAFDRDTVLSHFARASTRPATITVAVAGHMPSTRGCVDLFAAALRGLRSRRAARTRPTPPALAPACIDRAQAARAGAPRDGLPGRRRTRRPSATRSTSSTTSSGGSMSSRLFQEVRERQGLVYSVHSGMQPYRDSGLLLRLRGHGRGELRQGREGAPEGGPAPQEGRGHRRGARAGPRTISRAT